MFSSSKKNPPFFSYENFKSLTLTLLVVLSIRSSVFTLYQVISGSMVPTVFVGDRLFVYKAAYDIKIPFTDYSILSTSKIQRGDIIVFRYPRDKSMDFVKRVIGLPGDKIKISDNILYVNDQVQNRKLYNFDRKAVRDSEEESRNKDLFQENLMGMDHWTLQLPKNIQNPILSDYPHDSSEAFIVPEKHYFVMGDNRDNSADSRYWGTVPESYVQGKAIFILWSMNFSENWTPNFRFWRFARSLYDPYLA